MLLALTVITLSRSAHADPSVQIAWRLLDYIAVDYRGAVSDGKIISPDEYAEMTEFAKSAKERIEALPANASKASLLKNIALLQAAIANKASAEAVATTSRGLAAQLVAAYPVPLAPKAIPDLNRGKELYIQNCASCHGDQGDALGPAAAGLDPPVIAFTDKERAQERSLFGLYQVISQGLDGTSMRSFAELSEDDRWALAFYAGTFAYPESLSAKGKIAFESQPKLALDMTLEKLVGTTPHALAQSWGTEHGDAVTAYLRLNPAAVQKKPEGSLALARTRLNESLTAYQQGKKKEATDLALSAYLDGFEPLEPMLATKDPGLLTQVEQGMGALRTAISRGASSDDVKVQINTLDDLFVRVEASLGAGSTSQVASFFGAFAILLREGLEALLIVVAMISFLRKAEQKEALPYVHGGWISALFAGVLTWAAATWLITISGATRELTEGIGSVFAALVLLWVGIWMHGKSNAQAWQKYVRDHLSQALGRKSSWMLFGLSFLVVYREVFETILFYVAIWSQGNGGAVLAGALVASLLLVVIAIAMLSFSKVLPIGKFFAYSSSLIAVLAVVLIGKGVAALQEAGLLSLHTLGGFPRIDILGMYPTMEGAAAQAIMIGLLLVGFIHNTRSTAKLTTGK